MSRQKRGSNSEDVSQTPKSVDCEIGVISVSVDKSAAKGMKPKQRLQSCAFRGFWLGLVEALSFRSAATILNNLLHREDDAKIKVSTLKDRVESQGKSLAASYMQKVENILTMHNINPQDGLISSDAGLSEEICSSHLSCTLGDTPTKKLITEYNRGKETDLKLKYSDSLSLTEATSDGCCYISIDDIGVRFQKEKRDANYTKKKKFIENTVIHIQADNQQYTITAIGMKNAFIRLVAFLFENHLLEGYRLVFFTDGASVIRDYIEKYFGFRQHSIILDWLHLKKKCNEFLSMCLKGSKEDKAEIKQHLVSILWTGRIDKAIKYLESLKPANIKNANKVTELKEYLNRKSPNVTCYALRRELNLRISSNRVEKANDIVVATRQKHNGMSWSKSGSGALAIITAARINGELENWMATGEVEFKMVG